VPVELDSLEKRSYAFKFFAFFFLFGHRLTYLLLFFVFVVHYTPGLLNSLLGSAKRLDGNVSLQFQGHASLFSERSTPDRDVLIQVGDQCTMRSILTTASLEDRDRMIYQKPSFMFGDAAPDTDQQLLAGEGSGFSP